MFVGYRAGIVPPERPPPAHTNFIYMLNFILKLLLNEASLASSAVISFVYFVNLGTQAARIFV